MLSRGLALSGYEVVGLDLHPEMVEIANRNASAKRDALGKRLSFRVEDMCSFQLGGSFHTVILEDDGFGYLLTMDDQISCLRRIHEHLVDDGIFIFVTKTPQRDLARGYDEYDPVSQLITKKCVWDVPNSSGGFSEVPEGFERRKLTYPCELELLLSITGFDVVHRWGNLETRIPFTDPTTQDYMYLVRRNDRLPADRGRP